MLSKIKKLSVMVFIFIFFFNLINPAVFAANTTLYNQAAQVLKQKGVMSGDTKGNLNLDKPLKRSEISKMMIILLGKKPLADYYANQKRSSFKDVSSSHWALGYIEAAKSIGLISGYTDGTFKPEQNLKVEELSAIVIRSLGVKESELQGKWPLNYVKKAYDMGLYTGIETEVEIGTYVNRGQTAVILYNAFLNESLKSEKPLSLEYIDNSTVKVTFDKELKELNKSNFAFDNNLSVVDAKFADNTKKVVILKTSVQKEGTEYTLAYKGQNTSLKFTAKITPFALAEDIKVESLKKIDIKFTKPVASNSINSNTIRIYINDQEDTTAKKILSSDAKVLSIVFTNKLNQNDRLKIAISNVLSSDGQALSVSKDLVALDTSAPKAVEVRVINSKKFKLIFSEPMDINTSGYYKICDVASVGAIIKIDGSYVYAKITPKYEENAIEIENYSALSDGTHTIEVSEAKDFAGYKIPDFKASFQTVLDRTPPKLLSMNIIGNNRIQLTFDEELRALDNGAPTGEYEIYQASDATNHAMGAKLSLISDNKIVDIELSQGLKLDVRALASVEVRFRNVEDLLGNKDTNWQSIVSKAVDDTAKPQVKSIEVLDGNAIKVTFTENVDAKDKTSSFRLLSSDGQSVLEQSAKSVTLLDNSDFSTYIVEFSSLANINGGNFIVRIGNVKDLSIRENVMDESSYTIAAKDTLRPTITAAIAKYDSSSDNDRVDIFFSEPMNVDLLKNLSNYFVGAATATIPLSSIRGAKVDYISQDAQKITLIIPGADDTTQGKWSTAGGAIDRIAAPTLTDKNGNFLANATISSPFVISANFRGISPQDIEIFATDKNTLQIRALNGFIFGSFDPGSIMFRNAYATAALNGNPDNDRIVSLGIISYTISQDKTTVTLKTTVGLTSDAKADTNDTGTDPEELKIYTIGNGIKDQFEQSLSVAPTLDINFYPNLKLKDKISPQQISTTVGTGQNADTIIITFEEPAIPMSGISNTVLAAGIELKDGTTTLLPDVDYTAYIQNGVLYIKVKKPGIVDKTLSVEIKRADLITDLSGNTVIVSKAQTVDHVTEKTAPEVGAEFSTTDTRKVKITFSEPMDSTTLVAQNFSCVSGGNIINFTKSADNRWVEITFTSPLSQGAVVNLSPNIKDLAGNSVVTQSIRK